jgi:hypothetical protein
VPNVDFRASDNVWFLHVGANGIGEGGAGTPGGDDIDFRVGELPPDYFGALIEGYLVLDAETTFEFEVRVGDEFRLELDGIVALEHLDDPAPNTPATVRSEELTLDAGRHALRLAWSKIDNTGQLKLRSRNGPWPQGEALPPSVFEHVLRP